MKRALVLAGGGARGSYQVGMLQELVVNQGMDFSIIRGVSVGALNASYLAQAPLRGGAGALKKKVQLLRKLWTGLEGNSSVYAERGGFLGVVAGADSLYSLDPLKELIRENVSLKALKNSGRNFAVGTVSLVSGLYHEWTPRNANFIDKLIASASIPVVFPFIKIRSTKDILVDGGVRNITPLKSAFAAEPDEIYILLTSRLIRKGKKIPDSGVQTQTYTQWKDNWLGTKVGGLDVLKRTIEILTDEIYLDDIRAALKWNKVAESVAELKHAVGVNELSGEMKKKLQRLTRSLKDVKKRPVPIYVLAPREWFGKDNQSTNFSPELIGKAIKHGQEIASDPKLWLWPPVS